MLPIRPFLLFSLFLFLRVPPFAHQSSDKDVEQAIGLTSGRRQLLAIGLTHQHSLFLLLGDSSFNPDNAYVFNVPFPRGTSKVTLTKGSLLSSKYPSLCNALRGKRLSSGRSVILNDAKGTYLLATFTAGSNKTQPPPPLLYSLDTSKPVTPFSGKGAMETLLSSQFTNWALLSTAKPMTLLNHNSFSVDGKCQYNFKERSFNGTSLDGEAGALTFGTSLAQVTLCKGDTGKEESVTLAETCPRAQCLSWRLVGGFADKKRLFLITKTQVHMLENFVGSQINTGTLKVESVAIGQFFLTPNAPKRKGPQMDSSTFAIVIALLLSLLLVGMCVYACYHNNVFLFLADTGTTAAESSRHPNYHEDRPHDGGRDGGGDSGASVSAAFVPETGFARPSGSTRFSQQRRSSSRRNRRSDAGNRSQSRCRSRNKRSKRKNKSDRKRSKREGSKKRKGSGSRKSEPKKPRTSRSFKAIRDALDGGGSVKAGVRVTIK